MTRPMKKLLITLIATVIVNLTSQARYLTVNNNVGSVAMFTDIQLAIDSAKVGDTVFVMAGTYTSSITIKKRILLLGEGYTKTITNNGIYIDSVSGQANQVAGLILDGIFLGVNYYQNIKNTIIRNCFLQNVSNPGDYTLFVNNIITSQTGNFNTAGRTNFIGIKFHNNILNGFFLNPNTNNLSLFIFSNNVWIPQSLNGGFIPGNGPLINSLFTNNIFITTALIVNNGTGNGFSGNVTAGTDLPANNLNNIPYSSIFIEDLSSISDITTYTFKQLSTSPAKNYGIDGKDAGIYGGQYPWPNKKGDPGLPKTSNLVVQNAVLDPNGTLKFNFKAKSSSVK